MPVTSHYFSSHGRLFECLFVSHLSSVCFSKFYVLLIFTLLMRLVSTTPKTLYFQTNSKMPEAITKKLFPERVNRPETSNSDILAHAYAIYQSTRKSGAMVSSHSACISFSLIASSPKAATPKAAVQRLPVVSEKSAGHRVRVSVSRCVTALY